MPTPSHHHPRGGFTLIELAVVIVIVAAVAAVAFPRLIPILAYSELEGSARHAAQFGRAALGEAAMLSKELTIRIDLDKQQYRAIEMRVPEKEGDTEGELPGGMPGAGGGDVEDQIALLQEYKRESGLGDGNVGKTIASGVTARDAAAMRRLNSGEDRLTGGREAQGDDEEGPAGFDAALAGEQMRKRGDDMVLAALRARAKNVKHEDLLDEAGDLFEKDFSLEKEEEPEEVVLRDPSLAPVQIPEGVELTEVVVGEQSNTSKTIDIMVSPLGLEEGVAFYFASEDREDWFTAYWDPATGATRVYEGKERDFE